MTGEVCQLTTGRGGKSFGTAPGGGALLTFEAGINAAATMFALVSSPLFDLTGTYFLFAGSASISPHCGTLGTVAFARFVVQVGAQYEVDAREAPSNYTSGYVPFNRGSPGDYPDVLYGTEVFELNAALRERALRTGRLAEFLDTASAAHYRKLYRIPPATESPEVICGDVATAETHWHGEFLGDAFARYVALLTNGSGSYCTEAYEDSGSLAALFRGAVAGKVDFGRIIVMKAASTFDRPPPARRATEQLFYHDQGGDAIALEHLLSVGSAVVKDIQRHWAKTFEAGIPAMNYVGDVSDSLPGESPRDIGPGLRDVGS